MLRFNLLHFPSDIPIISEAKKMLSDRGLKCMELTWDEDDPRDNFTDLLASELNKVLNPEYGSLEPTDYFLDSGTKGVVVYDGTGTVVARMVMNPRWDNLNCKTLGFVSALMHVPDTPDTNDIRKVLMKCAEAFICGHVEREDEREIIQFFEEGGKRITLVVMCKKDDENLINFLTSMDFEAAERFYDLVHISNWTVPYEKELDVSIPAGYSTDEDNFY